MTANRPVPLPPTSLLSSLLSSLSTLDSGSSAPEDIAHLPSLQPGDEAPFNPLSSPTLSSQAKAVLTTLHCLLPNLLLPALDVLDRRLAKRLHCTDSPRISDTDAGQQDARRSRVARSFSVYHVRSKTSVERREESLLGQGSSAMAIAHGGAWGEEHRGPVYEVRLQAWNCTCAAFAFAAMEGDGLAGSESVPWHDSGPDFIPTHLNNSEADMNWAGNGSGETKFRIGGIRRPSPAPPMCKHILACLLAEAWPQGFGACVLEQNVSREEIAGLETGLA